FLERLFAVLSPSPHDCLAGPRPVPASRTEALRHRFISPDGVHRFLLAVRSAYLEYGSLERLYLSGMREGDARGNLTRFLSFFRTAWGDPLPAQRNFLFPDPRLGSACKRHHLFLRWMVRSGDGVDLGIWSSVSPSTLLVPVDTHMARLARAIGLTGRATADWRTAEEITAAFRAIRPDDPVRYDYALTRIGILGDCTARRPGACGRCPLAPVCRCGREPREENDIAVRHRTR
ncbi:MAG TPA: TIGR02757 family protein, partial [Candidatus Deferrimicrobiaceae bacterium]